MRHLRCFSGLFLVVSVLVGCSERSSAPASPSSVIGGDLAGTWNLVSIQPTDQAEQTTPAGAAYTLTLADGRVSTRVDCNTCSGAFARSERILTVGPVLACTRAACPTMPFGNAYTSLLGGDNIVIRSGTGLVLSSPRGVLMFTRQGGG